ncbi:hypothetical protein F8O07_06975 [Pseudoclavibacter sp. CFCC 13796]|uniref:hypothetical protein n=1 Tax=Pseudoclavibacter sp. CFCC 13796 TaxID=2615179 RepID=UPI0013011E3F|nr:hypothetical protein [Pseudoclavibacter sp. CFCC 13796]KAB1661642.1 hypothetical protein F8O07_06975 [Pseudoclavibacter sp. CFCC 13796]
MTETITRLEHALQGTGIENARSAGGLPAQALRDWVASEFEHRGREAETLMPVHGRFYRKRIDVVTGSVAVLCTRFDAGFSKNLTNRLEALIGAATNLRGVMDTIGLVLLVSASQLESSPTAASRMAAALDSFDGQVFDYSALIVWDGLQVLDRAVPDGLSAASFHQRILAVDSQNDGCRITS